MCPTHYMGTARNSSGVGTGQGQHNRAGSSVIDFECPASQLDIHTKTLWLHRTQRTHYVHSQGLYNKGRLPQSGICFHPKLTWYCTATKLGVKTNPFSPNLFAYLFSFEAESLYIAPELTV